MGDKCFGFTFQKNVIVLAVIDLVFVLLGTAGVCTTLVRAVSNARELKKSREVFTEDEDKEYRQYMIVIGIVSVYLTAFLVQIALSIFLLVAAFQRSKRKCQLWLQITSVVVTIAIIAMIMESIFAGQEGNSLLSFLPQVIMLLLKGYMIWTVYVYTRKLRNSNNAVEERAEYSYDQVNVY